MKLFIWLFTNFIVESLTLKCINLSINLLFHLYETTYKILRLIINLALHRLIK